MCRIDDCEPLDVYHETHPIARREHRCGECGRAIAPGESYQVANMLYDGSWHRYKACAHCQVAMRWLMGECGGWVADFVLEELHEHWQENDLCRTVQFGRLVALSGYFRRSRRPWHDRRGNLIPLARLEALVA